MCNILVVGTGAVGSYYGGKLFKAGAKVSTLCRSDYEQVKSNGIKINSVNENYVFTPQDVIKDSKDYKEDADYVIVATKVVQDIDIVNILRPVIKKNTSIVLIQNGIDVEMPIVEAFPENEIISGLAFICVSKVGKGEILHQDYGKLVIGKYPYGKSEKIEKLNKLFNTSEFICTIDEDIISARWRKLVWNAPFNPISVIGGGINTKEMLADKEMYRLVKNVMIEVVSLAQKLGHNLNEKLVEDNINNTLKMAAYKTSMLLDFENKRPLEVEVILGNPIRLARKIDFSVPYMESLYALLKIIDIKNRE